MVRRIRQGSSFLFVASIFPVCQVSAQSLPTTFAVRQLAPNHILKPDLQILLTPDQWGAQISPDNKKLVFTRSFSGTNEVWISDLDGSHLLKLTSMGGPHAGSPRWSPDGKWIAFDVDAAIQGKVFLVSVKGGPVREIAPDSNSQNLVPNWSRDGKWIYFASDRSGRWQVWKAPFSAGVPVPVTRQGGFAASESPDGSSVYYAKHRYPNPEVWRVPVGSDAEENVSPLVRPNTWADWSVTTDGIYFLGHAEDAGPALQFFDFETKGAQKVAELTHASFFLSVSNDARLAVCASF
jgi:Tol biopolymer transport system component